MKGNGLLLPNKTNQCQSIMAEAENTYVMVDKDNQSVLHSVIFLTAPVSSFNQISIHQYPVLSSLIAYFCLYPQMQHTAC